MHFVYQQGGSVTVNTPHCGIVLQFTMILQNFPNSREACQLPINITKKGKSGLVYNNNDGGENYSGKFTSHCSPNVTTLYIARTSD